MVTLWWVSGTEIFPAVSISGIDIDVISVIIGAIISASLALLIEAFAPPELRQRALYLVGKAKTKVRPPTVDVNLTSRFMLEDPASADEVSSQLRDSLLSFANARDLSANVERNDNYSRVWLESVSTSRGDLKIDLELTETPGGQGAQIATPHNNSHQIQALEVSSVAITVSIRNLNFKGLRGALENCYEYAITVQNGIDESGFHSGAYTVDLEIDSPPTVSRFLTKLDVDNLYTRSETFEIEFRDDQISITNQGEASIATVFDKVEDVVILYA